jgi:hypothetical protein
MKLDTKFYGEIHKAKDDSIVPDDQYIVFLVKDNAFWNLLIQYPGECRRIGCEEEQVKAAHELVLRAQDWRQSNSNLCKNPDIKGERTLE